MVKPDDFDYHLPQDLIAQTPVEPRDHSRLMVVNRQTGEISHDHFFNLSAYLEPSDLLIANQSKVIPARLFGTKTTGGKVEIFLLRETPNGWQFLGKHLHGAKKIIFADNLIGDIVNDLIVFNKPKTEVLGQGHTPLPPYIKVGGEEYKTRYQTVYAKDDGSSAAPTAGMHFTSELIRELNDKGIEMEYLTLHVGLGTFAPLTDKQLATKKLHHEYYEIKSQTWDKILRSKLEKRRVVSVGTTTTRTLESVAKSKKLSGETDIFIYPPYDFKVVDALITNFHLPKSSLMMLVSALAGKELIMQAYQEAVAKKYRFFSFGDAMLIV